MLTGPARRQSLAGVAATTGTTTCSATPARVAGYRAPVRSDRQRPGLPPTGVVASAVGAADGGQGQPSPAQGRRRHRRRGKRG
ncbi:hypothetical protein BHE74_00024983 [Ensete ventricosum]|nr:hypothetical protein BHE74_00024983 [Ensete ventricosum]RZR79289.1 hypothetical protein BHM03_00004982 [Ensete ventricosum]